jgi:hypothetical protein
MSDRACSEDWSADGFTRVAPPCTVDDGKFVGIVSRFELSGLELDRLVKKTGLWRTAFGMWMRRPNAPIFG